MSNKAQGTQSTTTGEPKTLMLPVAEVESEVTGTGTVPLRVQLKGQRPENRLLLEFDSNRELIETIHEAKKRGGTVWVRFDVGSDKRSLTGGKLVVRDLLE